MNQEILKEQDAVQAPAPEKNKFGIYKWIIGAVLVVVLAFFGFTAEVREGEYAVITRFGAVRKEVTEAGLYVKLPWPFENVTKYDVRNQYTESDFLETLTQDKRNIIMQSFAVWHVKDPLTYHRTVVGDNAVAELYINQLIVNASNSVLGKYQLVTESAITVLPICSAIPSSPRQYTARRVRVKPYLKSVPQWISESILHPSRARCGFSLMQIALKCIKTIDLSRNMHPTTSIIHTW